MASGGDVEAAVFGDGNMFAALEIGLTHGDNHIYGRPAEQKIMSRGVGCQPVMVVVVYLH